MDVCSPELVLVAPPDMARLARAQLPLPWEILPQPSALGVARPRRASRRPALLFGFFCALNGIAPIVLLIAAHR